MNLLRQFRTKRIPNSINPPELVADREVFSALSAECEKIIDIHKRLPDFVFRRSFDRYFAIEYAHIYRGEFATFLSNLSEISNDDSVNYMTLDPLAADYRDEYKRPFFGLASFKPETLVERYFPAISMDRNGPRLLAGVNVGVFWGSSLEWAISCDRISWELAVIAVPEKVDVPTMSGFRCLNAEEVSGYMKSQYHWKLPTALDFNQRFLANYPLLQS
jgi:hypothetical protein